MDTPNSTRLLSQTEQTEIENRIEARRVYWITAVLSLPLFGFGFFRSIAQSGQGRLLGVFELLVGVLVIINALLYFRFKNRIITKSFISGCAMVLSLSLLMTGGTHGTGIYWSLVYQATHYPFLGLRHGSVFSVLFIAIFTVIDVAQFFGLIQTSYQAAVLHQTIILLIILTTLGLTTERNRKIFQTESSKQLEQLRVLLEELPIGIMVLSSPDGQPKIVNEAMETLLGRDVRGDINLEQFIKIYGFTDENQSPTAPEELPLYTALKQGIETESRNIFIRRPDGTEVVTNVSATPILSSQGAVTSVIAIFEDETQSHEVDKMRSELISLVSHQLKTPMTSIKWGIEMILDGEAGELKKRQSSLLKSVLHTVNRLIIFVNDLLTVSRIETGRKFDVTPEPTNVTPIIKTVAAEFKDKAKEKEIDLAIELPSVLGLMADKSKFSDLMRRIIDNAIKYSNSKSEVRIGYEAKSDFGPALTVSDDGIGIPKSDHEYVFDRFFRGSNINEKTEGSGLGLYIAQVIADRHNGRICFMSTPGKGTTFYVSLKPATAQASDGKPSDFST